MRRPVSLAAVLLSSSPWDTRRLRRQGGQGRAWKPHAERSPQGEHRTGGVRGLRTLGHLAGVAYGPNKGDERWRTAREACRHRWPTPRGERICAGCRPAPGIRTSAGQPARSATLRGREATRVGQRTRGILRCSKIAPIMDPSPPPSLVDFKAQAFAWAFFLAVDASPQRRSKKRGHGPRRQSKPRSVKAIAPAPATTMWSSVRTSTSASASWSRRVNALSAALGSA